MHKTEEADEVLEEQRQDEDLVALGRLLCRAEI